MSPDTAIAPPALYHGECLEQMRQIPDGSIDMVMCDLPYGTTACKWDTVIPLKQLWKEYQRICKPAAAIVLTACQPFTSALIMSNPRMFKHEWIWHKSKSGSAFTAKFRPLARHENVLVFSSGSPCYNPQMREGAPYARTRQPGAKNNHNLGIGKAVNRTVNTGFRYPETVIFVQQKWRRQDQLHPTQKPVPLMEYLIRTYSNPGETILDNAMGSGSTGVACVNTGRHFIGIEKELEYFQVARDRILATPRPTESPPPTDPA